MTTSRYRLKIGPQEIVLYMGETLVGRSEECNLCLDDERLSRIHAKLIATDSQIGVVDMGSRNGTYVNDTRIRNPVQLYDGDQIRVGQTVMTVHVSGRAARSSRSTGRTLGGATLVDMSPTEGEESDVLYRVLKLGRLEEAEKLLKARVANLVRADPPLSVDHVLSQNVQNSMVAMADKSMDARWIHRLFKLHVTCGWLMTEELQKRVEQLIRAIGRSGGDGVGSYLSHWATRGQGLSDTQKSNLARLKELASRDSKLWPDS